MGPLWLPVVWAMASSPAWGSGPSSPSSDRSTRARACCRCPWWGWWRPPRRPSSRSHCDSRGFRLVEGCCPSTPVGVLGTTGLVSFLLATQQGLLTVVSVTAALYPAATVILAALFLHEKIGRLQSIGRWPPSPLF